jgi:polyphosphate kinase
MPRNLDRRVEALTPVDDPELQAELAQVLDVNLADDVLAWSLGPDGDWMRVPTVNGVDTHLSLQRLATERSDRRDR